MKFDELEISDYSVGDSVILGCTFRKMPIDDVLITDYDVQSDYSTIGIDMYYILHARPPYRYLAVSRQFLEDVDDAIIIGIINEKIKPQ